MFEIDKKKFGAFIAELRKEKGMTQKELAEKLFISDKAVSKWETAQSIPDITLLRPLADIFEVTTTELLECRRIPTDSIMNTVQTEALVQKVISYPEKSSEEFRKIRKKEGMLFAVCMLLGLIGTYLYTKISGESLWVRTGPSSLNFSNVVTMEILCFFFGLYFCFFAKEKLPVYYDDGKISFYSHGVVRIHMPGIHFNNSNWPHMLKLIKRWCMVNAVIYPLISLILWRIYDDVWGSWNLIFLLVVLLGGLVAPIYAVAIKYE